jgi:dihydroorotate dehydrogenase electron transfer subunit
MKRIIDMEVTANKSLSPLHSLLTLTPVGGMTQGARALAEVRPGQFVQVKIDGVDGAGIRRPISVNMVEGNRLELLVMKNGRGTNVLAAVKPGTIINVVLPLGNGFVEPAEAGRRPLLIGGGVGVAPLLYFGKRLAEAGVQPTFLLGAKTADLLLQLDRFSAIAPTAVSTDDGSLGHHGMVTANPVLDNEFDAWYCCGPTPMMKAVARMARERGITCHVSLENMMACGVGACLCCVEKTVEGNKCVCTYGPVFNINELTWQ